MGGREGMSGSEVGDEVGVREGMSGSEEEQEKREGVQHMCDVCS